jgi:hypothetical protein
MKQQACWYHCDTPNCDEESPQAVNFSDARLDATKAGWIIHPSSGDNQKHLGPVCVDKMMGSLGAPAVEEPAPAAVARAGSSASALDETPF